MINWDCIWVYTQKTLTILGGFSGIVLFVIFNAKLFGKNILEHWFNKDLAKYKKDLQESLDLKKGLQPERIVIVRELYSKIHDLHKSAKLVLEFYNIENISTATLDDESDTSDIVFELVFVTKENINEYRGQKIFTASEILETKVYDDIKKEILNYILQQEILLNSDIIDNIKSCIFLMEIYVLLNFPKEVVETALQKKGYDQGYVDDVVGTVEGIKQSSGLNQNNIAKTIDNLFDYVKELLRKQIGSDN